MPYNEYIAFICLYCGLFASLLFIVLGYYLASGWLVCAALLAAPSNIFLWYYAAHQKHKWRRSKHKNRIYQLLLNAQENKYLLLNNGGCVLYVSNALRNMKTWHNHYLDMLINQNNLSFNVKSSVNRLVYNENWVGLKKHSYYLNDGKSLVLQSLSYNQKDYFLLIAQHEMSYEIMDRSISAMRIAYYELDESGIITLCSSYFANILGYKIEQLLDTSFDDLLVEQIDISIRNDWQGFAKLRNAYGDYVLCFISHQAVINANQHITKILGHITVAIDSNMALQQKNQEQQWIEYSWRSFFENSPYPVAIVDRNGMMLKSNHACQQALNSKSKDFFSLFVNSEEMRQEFHSSFQTNYISQPVTNIYNKNGDKLFNIYFGKILDLKNEVNALMVRITDVTKEHELQDSLSHAQRMQTIGQLVGSIAHDFNNLLTAISGFSELLLQRYNSADPAFIYLMQIKQNADRATNLVKRLLAFSRKQTLQTHVVNLGEVFADLSSLIRRLLQNQTVLNVKIEHNLWYVKVDPVQIEQVLLNLIVNANQACAKSLYITIENRTLLNIKKDLRGYYSPDNEQPEQNDYVMISVRDDGVGMEKNLLMRIFEPFFTTKLEKSGTGLGLSTVYGIVKQSEGFIFVKSKVGVGTTFMILLKRSIEEPEQFNLLENNTAPNNLELSFDMASNVIALVEDEDSVRMFTASVLRSKGYEVIEYASAKEAIEHIDEFIEKIDLLITDVMMPEITGIDLVKIARTKRLHLKVIFLSGYAEDTFNNEYGANRAFHFIMKPFALKALLEKVHEVLNQ